jgi:putative nucleotide binding protein
MDKEEHAIILEYLPNGYPLDGKMRAIAQAIGEKNFVLLELIPRRGVSLQSQERVYIGEGKRDKIYYILGRLNREKLTEYSKEQLQEFINKSINDREEDFVKFFNEAGPINKRVHQIELLPGIGKKHMREIIEKRKEKEFESFKEMKERIQNLPDPAKAVEKRILQELTNLERYNLFIK